MVPRGAEALLRGIFAIRFFEIGAKQKPPFNGVENMASLLIESQQSALPVWAAQVMWSAEDAVLADSAVCSWRLSATSEKGRRAAIRTFDGPSITLMSYYVTSHSSTLCSPLRASEVTFSLT